MTRREGEMVGRREKGREGGRAYVLEWVAAFQLCQVFHKALGHCFLLGIGRAPSPGPSSSSSSSSSSFSFLGRCCCRKLAVTVKR